MIRIFHSPGTRSIRVVWLCEEMGLPYEIEAVQLGGANPEMAALNPVGTIPVLVDGDLVLTESVTMMEYVAQTYGPTPLALDPSDDDYWDYKQQLMFGEATLAAPINYLVATVMMAPADQRENFTASAIRGGIKRRLKAVQRRVAGSDYVVGERFTLADISVVYAINLALNAPNLGLAPLITPELLAYHDRLAARPAFQRMILVR